jgi:uncharacterized protein
MTVDVFHHEVDERAQAVAEKHRGRLQCRRGCSGCCVDGLTVFEVEAASIRARHGELLANGAPHPPGACAFLDADGACRIYEERPYVCRTQGLPLRWIDEDDGQDVERRDICELNDVEGPWPNLLDLGPDDCWTIGPAELRLQELQRAHDANGELHRVALRSLFLREQ